jgi:hypothetical protein
MKMTFILIILISAGLLLANPILEGSYITEIYFDETGWSIELYSMIMEGNLDNCKISSNAGEAYFLPGILFPPETYLVVTQDDLQTPLEIDEQGDYVTSYYDEYEASWCTFGTLQTMVLAPTDGQSLVPVSFSSNGAMTTDVSFCKDNTPTLGGMNNNGGIHGIFCGYVFDSLMNPVSNVQIEHFPYNYNSPDVVTNENGYFEKEMYAMNFYCDIHLAALASMDSTVSIEPDSMNFYEFVFENYVVGVDEPEVIIPSQDYHLSNHPNPFNPSTAISFDLTTKNAKLEIYNYKGQKVDELSVHNNQSSITWEADNFSSGVYLYKLIADGKEVASNKMLLLK